MALTRLRTFVVAAVALAFAGLAGAAPVPSNLVLLTATERTVMIGWVAADHATGYALYRDGVRVATAGPAAVSAKFGVSYGTHTLGVESSSSSGRQLSTITVTNTWRLTGTAYPSSPIIPGLTTTANIWVSATGNDSGTNCVRSGSPIAIPADAATVCATVTKAVTLVAAGDTIGVHAGSYAPTGTCDSHDGNTHCWYTNTNFASTVTVGVDGVVNLTGSLVIGSSSNNITFTAPSGDLVQTDWSSSHNDDGLSYGGLIFHVGSNHTTINGLTGYDYEIDGSSNVLIENGSIGGTTCYEPQIENSSDGVTVGTNITITHESLHDFGPDGSLCAGKHVTCTIVHGGNGVTLSNNTCSNSAAEGFLFRDDLPGPVASNVTVSGNTFTSTSGGGAIYQHASGSTTWSNYTISGNTATGQGIVIDAATGTFSGESVTSNSSGTLSDGLGGCPNAHAGINESGNMNSSGCP